MAGLLGAAQYADAQIFGGISDSGAVVLSNTASDEARTVVVAASPSHAGSGTSIKAAKHALASQDIAPPEAFQPFILEASAASGLPAELIHAVIKVESNYNPRALSSKGARGLMQLMPATAKRFGSTNSFDPRDNILTGCRYLRWLMDYFNQNIELAVAAYNAGENAVVKAGHKIPAFPETQKYVPKVLQHYRQASGIA
ncbi:lytic transglycosylase domain-containing protein [Polaromonas jejuensis]|uniref:Lytic transglycosylase domain-containing protein n=1 Tax=Polaromonas jejuensis TaxID=457502 RepID=A0ABW0QB34_9BURK